MAFPKCWVLLAAAAAASATCQTEQKFPLRQGEWEVSTLLHGASQPIVLHVCLNDTLWTKALSQTPDCSIQGLRVWAKGVNYSTQCPAKNMKANVELTFDGKEHMTGKASIDATLNGTATAAVSLVDYRWKNAICGVDDVNLMHANPQPAQPK